MANENDTSDTRLSAQSQFRNDIMEFNEELKNNTYDFDNIVDNGVMPDTSYLDGYNRTINEIFRTLGNLLIDPDNVENVTIIDPTDSKSYILKGIGYFLIRSKLVRGDDYIISQVHEDVELNKYLNFLEFVRLLEMLRLDLLYP